MIAIKEEKILELSDIITAVMYISSLESMPICSFSGLVENERIQITPEKEIKMLPISIG